MILKNRITFKDAVSTVKKQIEESKQDEYLDLQELKKTRDQIIRRKTSFMRKSIPLPDEMVRWILMKPLKERSEQEISLLCTIFNRVKFLKDIEVNFGISYLRNLIQYLKYEHFNQGSIVILRGTKGEQFYIILQGIVAMIDVPIEMLNQPAEIESLYTKQVKLKTSELLKQNEDVNIKNKNQDLKFLHKGEAFGEVAFYTRHTLRTSTLVANEDCQFAVLQKQDYMKIIGKLQENLLTQKFEFFQTVPIFQYCNNAEIRKFTFYPTIDRLTLGAIFYQKGDRVRDLFTLEEGEIYLVSESIEEEFPIEGLQDHIKKLKQSQTQVVVLGQGEFFGTEDFETQSYQKKSVPNTENPSNNTQQQYLKRRHTVIAKSHICKIFRITKYDMETQINVNALKQFQDHILRQEKLESELEAQVQNVQAQTKENYLLREEQFVNIGIVMTQREATICNPKIYKYIPPTLDIIDQCLPNFVQISKDCDEHEINRQIVISQYNLDLINPKRIPDPMAYKQAKDLNKPLIMTDRSYNENDKNGDSDTREKIHNFSTLNVKGLSKNEIKNLKLKNQYYWICTQMGQNFDNEKDRKLSKEAERFLLNIVPKQKEVTQISELKEQNAVNYYGDRFNQVQKDTMERSSQTLENKINQPLPHRRHKRKNSIQILCESLAINRQNTNEIKKEYFLKKLKQRRIHKRLQKQKTIDDQKEFVDQKMKQIEKQKLEESLEQKINTARADQSFSVNNSCCLLITPLSSIPNIQLLPYSPAPVQRNSSNFSHIVPQLQLSTSNELLYIQNKTQQNNSIEGGENLNLKFFTTQSNYDEEEDLFNFTGIPQKMNQRAQTLDSQDSSPKHSVQKYSPGNMSSKRNSPSRISKFFQITDFHQKQSVFKLEGSSPSKIDIKSYHTLPQSSQQLPEPPLKIMQQYDAPEKARIIKNFTEEVEHHELIEEQVSLMKIEQVRHETKNQQKQHYREFQKIFQNSFLSNEKLDTKSMLKTYQSLRGNQFNLDQKYLQNDTQNSRDVSFEENLPSFLSNEQNNNKESQRNLNLSHRQFQITISADRNQTRSLSQVVPQFNDEAPLRPGVIISNSGNLEGQNQTLQKTFSNIFLKTNLVSKPEKPQSAMFRKIMPATTKNEPTHQQPSNYFNKLFFNQEPSIDGPKPQPYFISHFSKERILSGIVQNNSVKSLNQSILFNNTLDTNQLLDQTQQNQYPMGRQLIFKEDS